MESEGELQNYIGVFIAPLHHSSALILYHPRLGSCLNSVREIS